MYIIIIMITVMGLLCTLYLLYMCTQPQAAVCVQRRVEFRSGALPPCFTSAHVEEGEREVAARFTKPDACVLEFGGGSGAVSAVIQEKLRNRKNHVVVQPEEGMFGGLSTLRKNRSECGHAYTIIDHILKSGEGTDLLRMVSKPFDTLVVDCEGCLEDEYYKNPVLWDNIEQIQVERDEPTRDDPTKGYGYAGLFKKLGFSKIHTGCGCGCSCNTEVWERILPNARE